MNSSDERPSAVERVLAEWFLLVEEGAEPDLAQLCGGDTELLAHARRLLDVEPEVLRRQAESSGTSWSDDEDELAGTTLADFRIIRRLASGGMGTVYLALQEELGRRVALKVVDRSRLAAPHAWERLRREAAVTASLKHPHIVPVYGIGAEGERCFIAMGHLTGPALSELELPLAPREAARIGRAIADALDAAHGAGVVHRDVKPANILLDDDNPCLVDFGLARSTVDPTLTSQGSVPGTLPYMAPELLGRDRPVLDPRADVYALGATLYELLSGEPPFLGREPEITVRKILLQDPAPLDLGRTHRDLETIVQKALEKEPRHRYPSARDLADDLERYLADEPIAARPTSRFQRLARRVRRHPRTTALAATGAAALIVLATLALLARQREARALDSGMLLVESALDEGRVESADRTLRGLLADHERMGELASLADRADAELAVHRLFTKLYQRPLFLNSEELERAVEAARETDALGRVPGFAAPLVAIAQWTLGNAEAAGQALAALRETGAAPLAAASVAELLGEEPGPLPAEGTADEHVVRSLVLHLLGRPFRAQEQQLQLALEASPASPRALFARAVLLAANGRYSRARDAVEFLVDKHGDARDALRVLVQLRTRTGDLEGARRALRSIPEDQWGAYEAYADLELLFLQGDHARLEERLAAYRDSADRWGAPYLLDLAQAEYIGHVVGDTEKADELFAALLAASPDRAVRDSAAASRYRMHVDDDLVGDSGGPDRVELAKRRDEGRELWASIEYRRARGVVAWKLGMALLCVGPSEQGFRRLEQAIELIPYEIGPRVDYAEQVLAVAPHARKLVETGKLAEGTDAYLLARAGHYLSEAVAALEDGDLHANERERVVLARFVVLLATEACDWALLLQARSLLASVPRTPAIERACARARDAFERLYGPGQAEALLLLDDDEGVVGRPR